MTTPPAREPPGRLQNQERGYNVAMSDTPATSESVDEPGGDELRQHAQSPAEGPEEETEQRADVPRVHPEDPAEG
jgi:hypothetical protein